LVLWYSVPILNTFAATSSGCVLSIVKRIAAFPGLPAIEGRFSWADGFSDSILSSSPHSNFALPARIIDGFDINIKVPEVMPNQLIFQRTPRVLNIRVVSLVHSREIHEIGSAVSAAASLYVFFAAFLSLTKTMKIVITVSAGTCHLRQRFALFARHLVIPFPKGPD
jgi:hypothetical protein